ncbi:spore germination protein [Brevibacillus borstelensis]|uniref:spore germination protein n=1 Tax=Brevibacillus borstelensis TaxID=45462 RepID=UPI0018CC01DE|nr:spore germination protein [Brevibacillus borstelensis]MED1852707.1 spore germination protein [Brevibacillus borstelensis]
MRNLRDWLRGKKSFLQQAGDAQVRQPGSPSAKPISTSLSDNMLELRKRFPLTPDLIIRHMDNPVTRERAILVYLSGLVDRNAINNILIRPFLDKRRSRESSIFNVLTVGNMDFITDWNDVKSSILLGNSLLFLEGQSKVFVIEARGWPQRAIEDPQSEASLLGAHQGFVETSIQNIAMIRRYIPNRELKIQEYTLGSRGISKASVLYLADVAKPEVVKEMVDRLQQVNIDTILNTGELREIIEDSRYSPFPQLITTERPDTAASHILQGRVAVVVDRTPKVLIGPAGFVTYFQNVDDYNLRWPVATFIRTLRFMAFLVATFLPALYIAVVSFNYEIIPLDLLLSVGESRERVPFPPLLEAMLMEITLEMLREAGIRLPAPIGQTVGIVGGIVIGQAAVQAGIVSNIMVIVVAFTAIASFIIPNYDMASAVRLVRFLMMGLSAMFGIVGIVIGLMGLIGHMIALESLGVPYGAPLAPARFADWKDLILRIPLWDMDKRPVSARAVQTKRQGTSGSGEEGQ